jgi:hypothetical protein
MALIVDVAAGDYPEVAEMGQFNFNLLQDIGNKVVHVHSPYVKRGWTWSALHRRWLQQLYPHMRAYLLHINGGR